jgi:hypothetical protein
MVFSKEIIGNIQKMLLRLQIYPLITSIGTLYNIRIQLIQKAVSSPVFPFLNSKKSQLLKLYAIKLFQDLKF